MTLHSRVPTSDWSANSFVMVVYENIFKAQSEFSAQLKTFEGFVYS